MALLSNLDFWDLVVSVLTPLIVIVVGYNINRSLQRRTSVTERKVTLFDQTAPDLNSLYCYFLFIGNWKELSPPEVLAIKRKLDRDLHINRFLFSTEFFQLYTDFMNHCFQTFTGVGQDAKIRSPLKAADGARDQAFPGQWNPDWNEMFAEKSQWSDHATLHATYHRLMQLFAKELGMSQ
jgi:hypothetical protein